MEVIVVVETGEAPQRASERARVLGVCGWARSWGIERGRGGGGGTSVPTDRGLGWKLRPESCNDMKCDDKLLHRPNVEGGGTGVFFGAQRKLCGAAPPRSRGRWVVARAERSAGFAYVPV